MTLQSHSWAYIQRKTWLEKIQVPQGSMQHIVYKTWEQPKCPSTEEWIKKVWWARVHTHARTHTHTGILLSH